MRLVTQLAGLAISSVLLASSASATIIRIDLSGYLYNVTPSVSSAFHEGEAAKAWFTFDSTSPGQAWYPGGVLDPAFRFYPNAPLAGSMSVGGYKVTFGPGLRMFVSNNEVAPYGPIDRVILDDYDAIASPVLGLSFRDVFINWQDNSAQALSNLALPTSQAVFDRLAPPRAAIDWQTNDATNRISAIFTAMTVSAVPEPATWLQMLFGIGCAGAASRRRRPGYAYQLGSILPR